MLVLGIGIRPGGAGRKQEQALWRNQSFEGLQRLVRTYMCMLRVVETGTTQQFVVHGEPQWSYQMQRGACVRAKPYNVTRVGRNLGLIEDHVKHVD